MGGQLPQVSHAKGREGGPPPRAKLKNYNLTSATHPKFFSQMMYVLPTHGMVTYSLEQNFGMFNISHIIYGSSTKVWPNHTLRPWGLLPGKKKEREREK